MSRHRREGGRNTGAWIGTNAVVLVVASVWVLGTALGSSPDPIALPPSSPGVGGGPAPSVAPPPPDVIVPTRDAVLARTGTRFGVSTPRAPFNDAELDEVTANAGAAPTLIQYFVKWTEPFRPDAARLCYERGAVPVISWEPWAGESSGTDQEDYSLDSITAGEHDSYIARFAATLRDNRWPVVLRFAHEMNGDWYSWSEKRSGNSRGDFVEAWRHVHDIFTEVGATNVVWVWSPNIVRPVPSVDLRALYPGDSYVDWVGMVGYAGRESTAAEVFEPTLELIRAFTDLPVLITETGARPDERQARWTADLFGWLTSDPSIVGFVWFEYNKEGSTADWRFGRDPVTREAFRAGLARTPLAPPVSP